jgi:hypothetical protein
VLASWARRPPAGAGLVVVLDRPHAPYSGMVPAWLAGECREDELGLGAAGQARGCAAAGCAASARSATSSCS